MTKQLDLKESIINKIIYSANSNLTTLTLGFNDGQALIVQANGRGDNPYLSTSLLSSHNTLQENDAICKVDWSWILNSRISNITVQNQKVILQLIPKGPLNISVQVWQDKPFLSFMPYKAP